MRLMAAILLFAALSTPALAEARSRAITKVEARQLTPRSTARRVVAQIGDILVETPRPTTRKAPTRPLSNLWFWTRVRPSYYRDICAADLVRVHFSPARRTDEGAETPVLADGLNAKTLYYFARLPASDEPEPQDDPNGDPAGCRKLSAEGQRFIDAPDEEQATKAMWRLGQVLKSQGSADHDFTLECHGNNFTKFCEMPFRRISLERVDSIGSCRSTLASPGSACWELEVGDVQVIIEGDYASKMTVSAQDGSAVVTPPRIVKVTVSELIVIADELID